MTLAPSFGRRGDVFFKIKATKETGVITLQNVEQEAEKGSSASQNHKK